MAVIAIHVSASFTRMEHINSLALSYMTIDAFTHFAVPAFVFVSGFVLYNKYSKKTEWNIFYRKRLNSIVPQYFIVSTFYMVSFFIASKLINTTIDLDLTSVLYRYLTGGAFYHLWFFVLIIQLYIMYPFILKIYNYAKQKKNLFLLLSLSYILSILYSIFMDGHEALGQITLFSGYIFYFVLGMYINEEYNLLNSNYFTLNKLSCSLGVLFIGTVFYIVEFAMNYFSYELIKANVLLENFWTLLAPIYFASITLIFLYISMNLKSDLLSTLVGKIGSYSFAIYLVHAVILDILKRGLSFVDFDMNNLFYFPALFILTLLISIVIIKLATYLPNNKYIIGNIR